MFGVKRKVLQKYRHPLACGKFWHTGGHISHHRYVVLGLTTRKVCSHLLVGNGSNVMPYPACWMQVCAPSLRAFITVSLGITDKVHDVI
ncbi:hypothetical protein SERLADRAFT_387379 [Serpula lacrymans var. lacrymans S7.9]|uniref:Uncharacterized protein n=1 Tax=Serpula lacrymans var. lacrymans (strain S7.9) TaxID=578457 RepID=F8NSX2_SERL9|nr:uncharacterized protein SERLADRAFT_387379 [Serpula lacrymans var. lacrymans S7.9]EGO25445.1 hypothetical protein SERLADRAFT_387379 [Serpula lacrymans var. lacrymans S7.9]